LLLSLDLDWLLDVNDLTHVLFFSTNTIYKTEEQVTDKIGIAPHLYRFMASIGTQAKDNILNIKQFGTARFKKHLLTEAGELKEDFGDIVDELLQAKKYGMVVHENAKYKDWKDNLQLNLQLMSPIPIEEVDINELLKFKQRLVRKLPEINIEEFLRLCYDTFDDIALIDAEEFDDIRA